ncbi:hypothetical protein EYF80_048262 [Liparis tanakae]|uniref:Uncharacterized protein n=1 Tax=Liparis tanakae TaxID=230148 RepID=A0A4Z2FLB3_9TELE|nr:hypothetical protein EYF80_048262 [Liparis tanakae]
MEARSRRPADEPRLDGVRHIHYLDVSYESGGHKVPRRSQGDRLLTSSRWKRGRRGGGEYTQKHEDAVWNRNLRVVTSHMRLARLEVVSRRACRSMCPETVKMLRTRSINLRPCLVLSSRTTTTEYIPTPATAAPPPASKTTPEMYMSLRAWPGFGMWLASARRSRTPPQITSDNPVIKTTSRSDKPPLFNTLIRRRLRTQFMSCTAELSSCLSRTPNASRQRVVPTPSRHSLETLVVVERRPTPPSPQPRIRSTATQ